MICQLKGDLVRTIFLPDWKVKVTPEGRRRLADLMELPPEPRKLFFLPSSLLAPGVFVRRPK